MNYCRQLVDVFICYIFVVAADVCFNFIYYLCFSSFSSNFLFISVQCHVIPINHKYIWKHFPDGIKNHTQRHTLISILFVHDYIKWKKNMLNAINVSKLLEIEWKNKIVKKKPKKYTRSCVEMKWFDKLNSSAQELGRQYWFQTFYTAAFYHIPLCHHYNFICIAMVSNTRRRKKYHHVISGSMSFPMGLQVAWEFCNHKNASIWKQSNCIHVFLFFFWSLLCSFELLLFLGSALNSIENVKCMRNKIYCIINVSNVVFFSLFLAATMIPVDCFDCTVCRLAEPCDAMKYLKLS